MRFYFHVRDGEQLLRDSVGLELPDIAAARYEAEQSARELIAENIKLGDRLDSRQYEVWDDTGTPHFILPFQSVLDR